MCGYGCSYRLAKPECVTQYFTLCDAICERLVERKELQAGLLTRADEALANFGWRDAEVDAPVARTHVLVDDIARFACELEKTQRAQAAREHRTRDNSVRALRDDVTDASELRMDALLGIRTTGRDESHADQDNNPDEPTPYAVLERLANSGLVGKRNVLVDYGCGKGAWASISRIRRDVARSAWSVILSSMRARCAMRGRRGSCRARTLLVA